MAAKNIRAVSITGNVATVPLTKGLSAIIDASDVHIVDAFNWCAVSDWHTHYASSNIRRQDGTFHLVKMHRLIMSPSNGEPVDHVNGNGLDNRRANLRLATAAQNGWNAKLPKHNTSGITGVSFNRDRQRWVVQFRHHGRVVYVGSFACVASAIVARNAAMSDLRGAEWMRRA